MEPVSPIRPAIRGLIWADQFVLAVLHLFAIDSKRRMGILNRLDHVGWRYSPRVVERNAKNFGSVNRLKHVHVVGDRGRA